MVHFYCIVGPKKKTRRAFGPNQMCVLKILGCMVDDLDQKYLLVTVS